MEEVSGVNSQEVANPDNSESSTQPEASNNSQESSTNSKEYNWRQMEETNKRLRSDLEALRQEIAANKQDSSPQDDQTLLQEDDLITYNQHKKLVEKDARAIVQEELRKMSQAKQPLEAKAKYADYEQVVTNENIQKLVKEDPELDRLIQLSSNPYERVYKEIKRAEFYKAQNKNKESLDKLQANSQKPQSANSVNNTSPLSYANQYAKGSREMYDEMMKYRGGFL